MKVGFVVECVNGGPETGVLPALVSLIDGDAECEIESLGSKPKVLMECGRYARTLLSQVKCDRVVVLWDARPAWKEDGLVFEVKEEKAKAARSLAGAGLEGDDRVHLICIVEELEAWLLADGRGITARINQLRGSRPALKKRVPDKKQVERLNWPKSVMENVFKQGEVRAYNDWLDAASIAKAIPDPTKLFKNSAVFPELKAALT